MRCGVASSRLREPASAVAAAVRGARDRADDDAEVVLVLSTIWGDPRPLVAGAVRAAGGATVVGCTTAGVLSGEGEIEDGPGVVAVAFAGAGAVTFLEPAGAAPEGGAGAGATLGGGAAALPSGLAFLLADAASAHPEVVAASLGARLSGGSAALVGAVPVGPADGPPAGRFLGPHAVTAAGCGLVLPCAAPPIVGVTHGCRPVGPTMIVTAAHGNVIETLDDRPAFEAFAVRARPLLDDLPRAAQSVFLAVPAADTVDSALEEGFVIRGLLALDPDRGLLAATEPVAPGTPLRFAVRDRWGARADLRRMIDDVRGRLAGRRPLLGLYVACAGRGRAFFGLEDHDVAYLGNVLEGAPLAGLFAGGQLAPAAGRTRLQLFTGVLAVVPEPCA